ncbi:deoxyuridine 5'-triphosphate nucleotidohydrolase [Candidatus Micrarchaeota archaeon]|nr:deoxyuridine 5'-triphosphate nucleotidohydrolase [Candidatus Micrarchaeota archaeon]
MILPREIIEKSALVKDTISQNQFQPAGVDVSLKEAYSYTNAGKIDFDNKERKISDVQPISYINEEVKLAPGAYKVIFNEYVRIPQDAAAFCFPRSSLLRSGITLECAVWDPGYEGRSEALLIVSNPHGAILKRNAKIGQIVFVRLSERTSFSYEGVYKGENK